MDRRKELEANVRRLRERFIEYADTPRASRTLLRQMRDNWHIARDTLAEYDAKQKGPDILYTAQGNRAQKYREGL